MTGPTEVRLAGPGRVALGGSRNYLGSSLTGREIAALAWLLVGFATLVAISRSPWAPALPLLIVLACLFAILWYRYALVVPHVALIAVLTIALLQDVLIGLVGGRHPDGTGVLLLVAFTTALPAAFAGWFGLCRASTDIDRRMLPFHALAVAYLGVVLLAAAGGDARAMLPAFRNSVAFLVMFYCGYTIPGLDRRMLGRVVTLFGILAAATVGFGYLERFVLGDRFWVDVLNLDVIARVKNLTPTGVVPVPLPADFYSPIGGQYYRRMASFFATPISLGYFLAFAFLYALAGVRAHRRGAGLVRLLAAGVLGVTLLLTLVKGAFGIAGLGVLAMVAVSVGARRRWSFTRTVITWALLAIPVAATGITLLADSTAFLHLYGLVYAFQGLSGPQMLFGNGLGTGGTISARLGAEVVVSEATGAESGIGTLLYQFGLVGVMIYVAAFLVLLRLLFKVYADPGLDRRLRLLGLGVLSALFGLLGAVFLQENALAPVPIAPYYLFAGALLNVVIRRGSSDSDGPWAEQLEVGGQGAI